MIVLSLALTTMPLLLLLLPLYDLPDFHLQGGLTWLWLDAPYVITARKLFNWAVQENDKGNPFPVSILCHISSRLLYIRTAHLLSTALINHSINAMTSALFYPY
jgi:hypothetical protein